MYDIKAIYEADSPEDAVRLFCDHPQARIIAGGSDVLVQVREGKLAGAELISIHGIGTLRGIRCEKDGTVRIGALTSFTQLASDPIILEHIPPLAAAAAEVGSPQIRNIGTIGGNLCNASPTADTPPTLLAWDAELELTGPWGARRLPVREFCVGSGKTDLRPGELLTAVLFPRAAYEGYTGNMVKYSVREALDTAIVNCSVSVRLSGHKDRIEKVRAAFGGAVGPMPVRTPTAEAAAEGRELNRETLELFAEAVLKDLHPRDGWRASKALREQIAAELAERTLRKSILLGGGVVHE